MTQSRLGRTIGASVGMLVVAACAGRVDDTADDGAGVSSVPGSTGSSGTSAVDARSGDPASIGGSTSGGPREELDGGPAPETCTSNADCAADAFCDRGGDCEGTGHCVPRPTSCDDAIVDTCSCAGIYYASPCDAHSDGRDVRTGPVNCLSTGQCADWRIYTEGDCGSSLGWYAPGGASACGELIGCQCIEELTGRECQPGVPIYGSRETCVRAHHMCGS